MRTKQNFNDPSYLRSIRDGLHSGSFQSDNAAALPFGLSGIYEQAMPVFLHPAERKRFLEFFGVWALLKKEVSAEFVSTVLEGWTEAMVLNEITRNSKWFNVLAGGRYALYHERLRSFLQQRISENRFRNINDAIIVACRKALAEKKGDEWEFYALEHLSSHLLLTAMETGKRLDLKTLAYDTSHWNRQIEISKDFEWSRRMLGDMMLWASKYDDEEVIECALNQVDLHHLEQNDAPRIVELVKQNEMETALQRIEAFGGNDKEGLQRKFTLYMLCLMELTLLGSKEQPFRREAIEKLLKHLDENLPVDHSVLNWGSFFPETRSKMEITNANSYVVFKMAFEWNQLNLYYLHVFKRTNSFGADWIQQKGPFSSDEYKVMQQVSEYYTDSNVGKQKFKMSIFSELSKQKKNEEANNLFQECFDQVKSINNPSEKTKIYIILSKASSKHSRRSRAIRLLNLARDQAKKVVAEEFKYSFLLDIVTELCDQNSTKSAYKIYQDLKNVPYYKDLVLEKISNSKARNGKIEEAVFDADAINIQEVKSRAYSHILYEALYQKKSSLPIEFLLKKNILISNSIEDNYEKCLSYIRIYKCYKLFNSDLFNVIYNKTLLLISKMPKNDKMMRGEFKLNSIYKQLIFVKIINGEFEDARMLSKKLIKDVKRINDNSFDHLLLDVICNHKLTLSPSRLMLIVEQIKSLNKYFYANKILINFLISKKSYNDAFILIDNLTKLAIKFKSKLLKANVLIFVKNSLREIGEVKNSELVLTKVKKIILSQLNPAIPRIDEKRVPDFEIWKELLNTIAEGGEFVSVDAMLKKSLRFSARSNQHEIFESIIYFLVKNRNNSLALFIYTDKYKHRKYDLSQDEVLKILIKNILLCSEWNLLKNLLFSYDSIKDRIELIQSIINWSDKDIEADIWNFFKSEITELVNNQKINHTNFQLFSFLMDQMFKNKWLAEGEILKIRLHAFLRYLPFSELKLELIGVFSKDLYNAGKIDESKKEIDKLFHGLKKQNQLPLTASLFFNNIDMLRSFNYLDKYYGMLDKMIFGFPVLNLNREHISFLLKINQNCHDNNLVSFTEKVNHICEDFIFKLEGDNKFDYMVKDLVVNYLYQDNEIKAVFWLSKINTPRAKSLALKAIVSYCLKVGDTMRALKFAESIHSQYKSGPYSDVAFSFIRNGEFSKALEIINLFGDPTKKGELLTYLCLELVAKDNYEFSNICISNISDSAIRKDCLFKVGKILRRDLGAEQSVKCIIKNFLILFHEELYRGVFLSFDLENISRDQVLFISRNRFFSSSDILEVLRYYFVRDVLSEFTYQNKFVRFDQTLDLQWAIDIKNSLNDN